MQGMGDLKHVAADIMQKLANGRLPVSNNTQTNSTANEIGSDSLARPRPSTPERLTFAQARRLDAIADMLIRYRLEKKLPPLPDRTLREDVGWYNEHFTRAGIPTDRLLDVYLEAMAEHGEHLLSVDDYLRAGRRINERGHGHASDVVRGAGCQACGGTGRMWIFKPQDFRSPDLDGEDIEADCINGCAKVVALVPAAQDE